MNPALEARDVTKRYGRTHALDGVTVSVAPGEVFGLIGPNGAGKTTLVRALTGTAPVTGEVSLLGAEPDTVARTRVGLLPQSFDPPKRLSALELLAYYRGLYDEGRDPEDVLSDVGLQEDATVRYENLSGGQQRRVCVGTALVNDPDILFLDEPTTGIDPAGRRAVWELIEGLAAEGTTVFLTSHAMDEVDRLADRAGLLRDGRLIEVGSPAELVATHGGQPRLLVKLRDSVARDPLGTTLERSADIDGGVSTVDDGVMIHAVRPRDIGDIAGVLETAKVDYEALSWREPSLEDVYLELTGESYAPFGGTRRDREPAQSGSETDMPVDTTEIEADGGRRE
nr:MAG: ABC-type multidrug transport system, ATPase component [Candidatus Nanosalinarum sp. J07AB56]